MYIQTINIRHFRNIEQASVNLDPHFNLLVGDNGAGKSNFLEAIFFASFFKGFRTNRRSDLFLHNTKSLSVAINLVYQHALLPLSLSMENNRDLIASVDDVRVSRLVDYAQYLRVILFQPEDVSLWRGSPMERRKFVDRMLFNLKPAFIQEMRQYARLIREKSAYLKIEKIDALLLDIYDEQIAKLGAFLSYERYQLLQKLWPFFNAMLSELFSTQLDIRMFYTTSWHQHLSVSDDNYDYDDFYADYQNALLKSRNNEIKRGMTTIGAQRDDFYITLNNNNFKIEASQGQSRAAVLALKMAEIQYLIQERSLSPVLLLDDVSSEFDAVRQTRFFDFLSDIKTQILLSSASPHFLPIDHKEAKILRVVKGHIS